MFLILPKLSRKRKMLLVQCLAMSCSSLHQQCPGKLTWRDGLSVCVCASIGETADAKIKSLGVSRAISRSCTTFSRENFSCTGVETARGTSAENVFARARPVHDLCSTLCSTFMCSTWTFPWVLIRKKCHVYLQVHSVTDRGLCVSYLRPRCRIAFLAGGAIK